MARDENQEPLMSSAGKSAWAPLLWIIAASALAHLWCLGSQFYMDDMTAIRDNERIRTGQLWPGLVNLWTRLGYVVQYRTFGMSPVGFHAVNWLLHTAIACVIFGFGRDFLRGRFTDGVAWFAALLFAVHPLASEIPNYARTQDLAWVTLFSLLASWALLRFLQVGGWMKLLWMLLGIAGATMSKGPGLFHALMMAAAVGLAFMTTRHWKRLRRYWWVPLLVTLIGVAGLWFAGTIRHLYNATSLWDEPRFIGHAYTLARVFWEFAWRAVIPVALSSDHHITESLAPPGTTWLDIPDKAAMWAAAAMLGLTAVSLVLAWQKPTRLFGVCLFLFVATMLFRVAYLIPEFMPEYRIYPGMPWFCLGAAIVLSSLWRALAGDSSPKALAGVLLVVFAGMSARRSFVWHDLDRLTADVLRQYPAQARALWELHDRDIRNEDWQKIIERQQTVWPQVFQKFMEENKRLAPQRALPTGHFALADVACKGRYAIALAHTAGPAVALAEIQRLELFMKQLGMGMESHRIHWAYFYKAKLRVLEDSGMDQAALDLMRREDLEFFSEKDIRRVEAKLAKKSAGPR